jgi:hypothetical protein
MSGIYWKITSTELLILAYRRKRLSEDFRSTFMEFGRVLRIRENVIFLMNTCIKFY